MSNLLIKNARLRDEAELKDILIIDGKFSKIEAGIPVEAAAGGEVIDADGCLVSPPHVDPHIHLDAVLSTSQMPRQNQTGTLIEAIGIWNEWKLGLTKEEDPVKVEMDLMKELPKDHWILWNIQIITLGRTICKAPTPKCEECFLKELCADYQKRCGRSKKQEKL